MSERVTSGQCGWCGLYVMVRDGEAWQCAQCGGVYCRNEVSNCYREHNKEFHARTPEEQRMWDRLGAMLSKVKELRSYGRRGRIPGE